MYMVAMASAKGLLLLSGGLDSILACKLLQKQNITLEAVHFSTPFTKNLYWPKKASEFLAIPTQFLTIEDEYMDIVREPLYGYGSNMNPCIDCRLMMLGLARDHMKQIGARFIVTGEVVGERPMTQNRNTMRMIEKRAGLDGLILRPLSAKLLPPSIPERDGTVKREELLDLQGRGRKSQLEIARSYKVKDAPTPAGGCLLTDPGFSRRVKDLIDHNELTVANVRLLLYGRHFRLPSGAKVIVGRNHTENEQLLRHSFATDYIFKAQDGKSPLALLTLRRPDDISIAASLCVTYARRYGATEVVYRRKCEVSQSCTLITSQLEQVHREWLI